MIFLIPSITEVVSRFKREWTTHLAPESIRELCLELGLSWRERLLTPMTTIQLMLLQVLHGNISISHLPHVSGMHFWSSSFCRARMRIPVTLLESLLDRISHCLKKEDFETNTWCGHRVFVTDGTGVSMSDTPALEKYFGYPSNQRKGVTFPVARLVFMLHLGTGMITKLLINPFRSHEMKRVKELHPELREGDVFLGDRAFCSFYHFVQLLQLGLHGVIRAHQKIIVDFTPGRAYFPPGEVPLGVNLPKSRQIKLIGCKDQIVEWFKGQKLKGMTHEQHDSLPNSIIVRELQYRLIHNGFRTSVITIITTLLDEQRYPAHKIAALYGMRWEIETNFNHLKTTMKMDILHSKTPEGIIKELYAYCIVYNLVRLVMLKAASSQRISVKRISFVDALRWLMHASPEAKLLPLQVVPYRPGRFEPRSRKRRPKPGYAYALLPRPELRKKKLSQCVNDARRA
jgi:IS4 transposase